MATNYDAWSLRQLRMTGVTARWDKMNDIKQRFGSMPKPELNEHVDAMRVINKLNNGVSMSSAEYAKIDRVRQWIFEKNSEARALGFSFPYPEYKGSHQHQPTMQQAMNASVLGKRKAEEEKAESVKRARIEEKQKAYKDFMFDEGLVTDDNGYIVAVTKTKKERYLDAVREASRKAERSIRKAMAATEDAESKAMRSFHTSKEEFERESGISLTQPEAPPPDDDDDL